MSQVDHQLDSDRIDETLCALFLDYHEKEIAMQPRAKPPPPNRRRPDEKMAGPEETLRWTSGVVDLASLSPDESALASAALSDSRPSSEVPSNYDEEPPPAEA